MLLSIISPIDNAVIKNFAPIFERRYGRKIYREIEYSGHTRARLSTVKDLVLTVQHRIREKLATIYHTASSVALEYVSDIRKIIKFEIICMLYPSN